VGAYNSLFRVELTGKLALHVNFRLVQEGGMQTEPQLEAPSSGSSSSRSSDSMQDSSSSSSSKTLTATDLTDMGLALGHKKHRCRNLA
jgi:hypothetical protein